MISSQQISLHTLTNQVFKWLWLSFLKLCVFKTNILFRRCTGKPPSTSSSITFGFLNCIHNLAWGHPVSGAPIYYYFCIHQHIHYCFPTSTSPKFLVSFQNRGALLYNIFTTALSNRNKMTSPWAYQPFPSSPLVISLQDLRAHGSKLPLNTLVDKLPHQAFAADHAHSTSPILPPPSLSVSSSWATLTLFENSNLTLLQLRSPTEV